MRIIRGNRITPPETESCVRWFRPVARLRQEQKHDIFISPPDAAIKIVGASVTHLQ
jgi:hypothetical protein